MAISVIQLGRISYASGLRLQQQLVEARKSGSSGDVLLLLEHTPVITLGRNAMSANVLASAELLAARGVEMFECDRGGDVTFHGPGQLVGYPIFDLHGFKRQVTQRDINTQEESAEVAGSWLHRRGVLGAVDYVRCLEDALIRTCADVAIPAERVTGLTGVWTESPPAKQQAKIAAIGVHISRGVTSHGFALNVNTDLSYFNLIVPCGIQSKPVTSMHKELGHEVELHEVSQTVAKHFGEVFERDLVFVQTVDELFGNTVGVPMQPPRELRELHREEKNFLA